MQEACQLPDTARPMPESAANHSGWTRRVGVCGGGYGGMWLGEVVDGSVWQWTE